MFVYLVWEEYSDGEVLKKIYKTKEEAERYMKIRKIDYPWFKYYYEKKEVE